MTGVSADDQRWMAAAIALAWRGRGLSRPNPNVGCVLISNGRVIGRGWTQPGGRPHAEAMALSAARDANPAGAQGATAYVTLEPCAHESARGPACAQSLIDAKVSRVVIAVRDPDPRTDGGGMALLRAAGISVTEQVLADAAREAMAGWWSRMTRERAFVTLKLATSLDGCIARADGESKWITGETARRHAHLLRAQSDAVLVGRGTADADAPALNVRLPGLEDRRPRPLILSGRASGDSIASPAQAAALDDVHDLLVEGGAGAAAAFVRAGLVDRLILYRAPILIGAGRASLGDIGLASLAETHGRWRPTDARQLGSDRMEVYAAARKD